MSIWDRNISAIVKTADRHPQESYAVVVHAIQPEWIFLQRVTRNARSAFTGIEKLLQETFPPTFSLEN